MREDRSAIIDLTWLFPCWRIMTFHNLPNKANNFSAMYRPRLVKLNPAK
jgi:hypothetical protein